MQQRALGRLRLLDLDDHLGTREHRRGIGGDRRARGNVRGIAHADARAGSVLDDHRMAVRDELAHRRGREADPILQNLDSFGTPMRITVSMGQGGQGTKITAPEPALGAFARQLRYAVVLECQSRAGNGTHRHRRNI